MGGDLLCVALAVLYIPMSRFASSNISFLRNILESVRERYIVYTPERDDNELCILGPVLDVVGNDRDVSEVQRSIDFIHEV
jgi:hypothetical protein